MQLNWRRVEKDSLNEIWNLVATGCEEATFFHTPVWANVLNLTFPRWIPSPIAIEFSGGNLMVMPLMTTKIFRPLAQYSESMLPGVYGGPILLKPAEENHWHSIWSLVNSLSDVVLYGNPYLHYIGHPNSIQRSIFTQVLDLTKGFDLIRKSFSKGHRADITVSRKNGVEVKIASCRDEVEAYFKVYQDAIKRWGDQASGFYPIGLFYNLFQLGEYGKTVKLWIACLQGRVIAGAWSLYHNQHVVYWHGAVHSQYTSFHPTHLLVATMIEDACRNGFRWFDFNPSGGLEGVERFKNGFGAQYLTFNSYRRLTPLGKGYRFFRYYQEHNSRKCSL